MAEGDHETRESLLTQQLQLCRELETQHPRDDVITKAMKSADAAISYLQLKRSLSTKRSCSSSGLEDELLQKALLSYTQSVLDSTYFTECQLVEKEFPIDTSKQVISAILECLSQPVSLCGQAEKTLSTLGTELWECLHWRAGALLYMYTHHIMQDPSNKITAADRHHLIESCVVGVIHLQAMLSARQPLGMEEEVEARDSSVQQVLQQGIFSDVHMLGLMYAGEMCYWAWQQGGGGGEGGGGEGGVGGGSDGGGGDRQTLDTCKPDESKDVKADKKEKMKEEEEVLQEEDEETEECGKHEEKEDRLSTENLPTLPALKTLPTEPSVEATPTQQEKPTSFTTLLQQLMGPEYVQRKRREFDAVSLGHQMLGKYIEVARGPLKQQNWNYVRAVQLSVQLRKSSVGISQ